MSIEAVTYKYASKEEESLPFTINVFNSKGAGGATSYTFRLEFNEDLEINLPKLYERINIEIPVDDEP